MNKPLILVTNDDGIYSEGIFVLQQAMAEMGQTVVVAPEAEKSAVGHAITISDPIRIKEISRRNVFTGYAVAGTPADCVKLAVKALLEESPDIVVSGINPGANIGTSVLYSGTVSAATEGVILGIPAIAISMATLVNPDYSYAVKIAKKFTELVLKNGLPEGTALNINVPNVPEEEVRGIKITCQGASNYNEKFDRRVDPRQRTYFWMDGDLIHPKEDPDLDDIALRDKFVSVTPLHYDLTNKESFTFFKTWDIFFDDR